MQIHVLIVDDHQIYRDGLNQTLRLESDMTVVGECERGEEALRLAQQLLPDVVVLDVNLPDINGLQVARMLRADHPQMGIISLTAYHETAQVLHVMRGGASAYCPKDIRPEALVRVIRAVAGGAYVVEGEIMDRRTLDHWLTAQINAMNGTYTIDAEEHYIPLSPRELEILQAVTQGLSNKEISQKLGISNQTVKNHMTSILKKLNVEDRTQAAVTALKSGWVRIDPTE
jgi:DNA-binding NarL/FixJ family response regulator